MLALSTLNAWKKIFWLTKGGKGLKPARPPLNTAMVDTVESDYDGVWK